MTAPNITLYGSALSGHTHRVEQRTLDLPYRFVSAPANARRSADFLSLNPLGQVPVLQDGDALLADSNAILVYLAKRHVAGGAWLSDDPVGAALVRRWLSMVAGEIASGPNMARLIVIRGMPDDRSKAMAIAGRLFHFMDEHLADRAYFAAAHPTIADPACYSYIAHAPEDGIGIKPCPSMCAWLLRIEKIPGFKPMATFPASVRT
jgi:glutathione S-transferase